MAEFTAAGQRHIEATAARSGFSRDAVASMLRSVLRGHGAMAQFDHPEFGGPGQWMRGGMTMVSDMFNSTLKARVERLCDELAALAASEPGLGDAPATPRAAVSFVVPGSGDGDWWPAQLGRADSTGAQNAVRYAYFPGTRRLAINLGGNVTIYDTQDHRITGVSQQQSGRGTITFSSQHGIVDIATLPVVPGTPGTPGAEAKPDVSPDIFTTIEKLAELRSKGVLSDAEFAAKKTELLSRL